MKSRAVITGIGGIIGKRKHTKQQKANAVLQLQQLLSTIVQKSQQQGARQFADNLSVMRMRVRDLSRDQIAEAKRRLGEQATEVDASRKRTDEESRKTAADAEARLKEIDTCLAGINKVCMDSQSRVPTLLPSRVAR